MGRIGLFAIPLFGIGCGIIDGGGDPAGPDAGPGGDDPTLTLVVTAPEDGDMRVRPDELISARFSHDIHPDSIDDETFAVATSSGPVAGSFAIDRDTVTFLPDAPHHILSTVTASLTTGIASDEAGRLAEPYAWSFQIRDGTWSSRIDLAEGVASLADVASNRRGDILLAYTASASPASIEAVVFDAAAKSFDLPHRIENDTQPSSGARGALSEDGDGIAVWSSLSGRGWARRTDGLWRTAVLGPGEVGPVAITTDTTAVMATPAGADVVIETLPPAAGAWSSPVTALTSSTISAVAPTGDSVQIIAFDEIHQQLVARAFTPAVGLAGSQELSAAGAAVDSVQVQLLPGRELAVTWAAPDGTLHLARFDGTTWSSSALADGVQGSAVCANAAGARLAAFIDDDAVHGMFAAPGEPFGDPVDLGPSTPGMESAGCALDELGNGHLFWARASSKSLRSRFAGGQFTPAEQLGFGPSMRGVVGAPATGAVRVVFFTGDSLTALAFE